MTTTAELAPHGVLAAARRFRAEAEAAEIGVLLQAVEWCRLHEATSDSGDGATWGFTPVSLSGEGAPLVTEDCIAEFAAALRVSTDSGRNLLADALEMAHRLPLVFGRVLAGDLPVWRARRIAQATVALSFAAAAYVDAQLAPFAHKTGPSVTERLVEEAIARFMPEVLAERATESEQNRFVTIEHDHLSGSGTSTLVGSLDTADAIDLEEALIRGAETLKSGGSEAGLDERRAAALGVLARGEQSFELARARDLTLYVHLDADAAYARVENHGGHLITVEQLATWCGTGNARVVVKPVIDLNTMRSTQAYEIPDRIREHVVLRDRTCVFPYCNRPARRCDLDHITPFPEGETSTENLACLCRLHHRLKTLTAWSYYVTVSPATGQRAYLWTSPHGYRFLRDSQGTQDLTPRPVDPPG